MRSSQKSISIYKREKLRKLLIIIAKENQFFVNLQFCFQEDLGPGWWWWWWWWCGATEYPFQLLQESSNNWHCIDIIVMKS